MPPKSEFTRFLRHMATVVWRCFGNNKTREVRTQYMYDVASYAYDRGICPILWDTPGGELNRDMAKFYYPEFIERITNIPY